MTHNTLEAVGLPRLALVLLTVSGCGARVALDESPGSGTQTDVTSSTATVTATDTNAPTPSGTTTSTSVYTTSTGAYTGVNTGYTTSTGLYTGATSPGTGVYTTGVTQTYTSSSIVTSTLCGGVPLLVTPGQLSVAAGYVTTGVLKGYGFTWVSTSSLGGTCITPSCGNVGCTPAFSSSALCAAGEVAADPTYQSAAGVGFNLNQTLAGDPPGSVAAPTSIIVSASMALGAENYTRVQLAGQNGTYYCVEAGRWAPGTAIPIGAFNSNCWDGTGAALYPGAPLSAIHLLVPSDATAWRPYSICLTNVSFG